MTTKHISPRPKAPVARRNPIVLEQLGRVRQDNYAWMKDDNWQSVLRDPSVLRGDIRTHLEAENHYAEAILKNTETLQKTLFDEMVGRIPPAEESVPLPDGPWLYALRFEKDAQYPLHTRRPRDGGDEEIILDVNELAKQHSYFSLAQAAHSDDHKFYVYAEDVQGSEVYRIQVKDLETGKLCAPPVESTTGSFTLSPDSQWLFWVYRDEFGRPSRIYRRPLRGGEDTLVFDETDPGFFISIGVSASRQWIIIERGDHDTNETLLIPAHAPTTQPVVAAPLVRGERYSLTHWNDHFIILTNHDGATDFKLMITPDTATGRDHWRSFLPHQEGHFILNISAGRDYLVWSERQNGNEHLYVLPRHAASAASIRAEAHHISMDEDAYDLSLLGILEYDRPVLRYVYQSPTTPAHWYDYNMETGEKKLRKVRDVPSGHNPSAYETRRLFATAPDGQEIPITVLMRKGTSLNGSNPMLLYGYGSYGISMEASFSTTALSLVDRGWIYAIAHIRGGSEKGWSWFLDGRGKNKTNSFTDYIASARHLIAEGYSAPRRIVAHGGSAGGLLMGAVANMAPELFAGIAAQVPFVDMLNTMSDTTLPLTPPEWPEWGNPLTDPEAYDLIASYSPYDNIRAVTYPPILAMGGLSDPRVTYWEPAKWIARLREEAKGGPFLCRINMEAGHGGSSGRFARLKEVALVQAFALWCIERVENLSTSAH
ncbi:prolyl oligopeptidase family serine peptidase [Saccharibacter sp. 17.LH.SD]|uniref:S9 family peptidase n=1 Tax=Saccharibacter sp. 17.LH.SD TaxID=2689393 RepID=UPI0013694E30|nr:S9 family peptidase [Saccharibacter sp. 17.LH.SD]MXV45059.1 prolyl oligopeptidase family serine peptidase [Saccharibacter sp. 17.LH.SD]